MFGGVATYKGNKSALLYAHTLLLLILGDMTLIHVPFSCLFLALKPEYPFGEAKSFKHIKLTQITCLARVIDEKTALTGEAFKLDISQGISLASIRSTVLRVFRLDYDKKWKNILLYYFKPTGKLVLGFPKYRLSQLVTNEDCMVAIGSLELGEYWRLECRMAGSGEKEAALAKTGAPVLEGKFLF